MNQLFKKRQQELHEFSSWLKRRKTISAKEIPDYIFQKCEFCQETVSSDALMTQLYVCPHCHHPLKISARERVRQCVDEGTWKELFGKIETKSSNFPGYNQKLLKAKMQTGLNEAVICGVGQIESQKVVMCVMDSHFMMGSMGKAVGEKICRSVEYAMKKKLPLIIFTASGGARMQEGIDSLMQMAKVSAALQRFSNQGGLYITVLTHPTTGGVSASFAMLGDIIISEPYALIGFAGKRVIQQTIQEKLPDNFQTAEFLFEKGFIDMIVERKNMKSTLADLLRLHGGCL